MKIKILIELKNSLMENKRPIFFATIIPLFFGFIFIGLASAQIIPKFPLLPFRFTGYWKEHHVTFEIDILYGIIMAIVLLSYKKKFSSLKEIGMISFWPSLFLVIIYLIILNVFLFLKFGLSEIAIRTIPLIIANFGGLIFYTFAFIGISLFISWIYFRVKIAKR